MRGSAASRQDAADATRRGGAAGRQDTAGATRRGGATGRQDAAGAARRGSAAGRQDTAGATRRGSAAGRQDTAGATRRGSAAGRNAATDDSKRANAAAEKARNKRKKAAKKRREKERKLQEKQARAERKLQKKELRRKQREARKPTKEELERRRKRRQEIRRRIFRVIKIIFVSLVVLGVVVLIALGCINVFYKLKKIDVSGNSHYTEQEIVEIVSGDKNTSNTLRFLLENKMNPVGDVTFIDKMDIEYVDRNTVSVTVYEKAMAGCIKCADGYAYFDGDGIVLEISEDKLADVPCIEGLNCDDVQQGERLTVGNENFFQEILTMTQIIYKNNIQIDRIACDDNGNLVLYKDGITIKMGDSEEIESKLMNLESILETLEGKSGTLDMSNYSESNGNVIFRENK
jgi:cell division septal protein FtsQ